MIVPAPSTVKTHGSLGQRPMPRRWATRSAALVRLVDLDVHERDRVVDTASRMSSSSSSTGPQYCDWQSAGVANITATGFPVPMTSASETVVQRALRAPRADRLHAQRCRPWSATRHAVRRCRPAGASGCAFTSTANGTRLPRVIATARPDPGDVERRRRRRTRRGPSGGRRLCSVVS